MYEKKIKEKTLRLLTHDITDLEVEAFVYYARPDLKLGTGFGGAIAQRGGPSVQKELDEIGETSIGNAVVTSAGKMKAKHIIHAVGPAFHEEDEERKLEQTIRATLDLAEKQGFKQIALPPMGCGFYGVEMATSSRIMFDLIEKHLQGDGTLEEVIVCLNDKREYDPFQSALAARS